MTEERRRHPPQPGGPVEKGGEEESAFTPELPPYTHTVLSEGTHTYRLAQVRGDEGGLSDAVCMLRRQEAVTGGTKGREKTLKLDSNLSRPSNMRSPPGLGWSLLSRSPRGGGLGSPHPVPCLRPIPSRAVGM